MAITNTLTAIKDYFIDWHTQNYRILHETPLNAISDNAADDNKLVTNKAVRDKVNNATMDVANAKISVGGRTKTVQTTLNDFDSRLGDIEQNTVRKTDLAYYSEPLNDIYNSYDTDYRGFKLTLRDKTKCKNGLLTWQEKMNLKYMGEWKQFDGSEIGSNKTTGMRLYINPGLRLVFFHFGYTNCPYLYKEYKASQSKNYSHAPANSSDELFYLVRPITNIWGATNWADITMGVENNGDFHLRSKNPVTDKITIGGSLMWFYGDDTVSSKIDNL